MTYALASYPNPPPPPDSSFELLVIALGIPPSEVGFLEQFTRVRAHLRREVDRRRRELAKGDEVELYAPQLRRAHPTQRDLRREGCSPREPRRPCALDCKSPARAARVDAEAVRFVEDLGERAGELAGSVAALR